MEVSDIIWEVKKEAVRQLVFGGKRPDGRASSEYRKIEFVPGFVAKAEGSCFIRLGNTQALVGVKMDVGEPYPDSPDQGTLITNTELVPLASPTFSSGPPDEMSVEISRVVDRGIRASGMIDFKKLCITEGELVWNVLVDIHVLDHDGNLIDAGAIAAVKALQTAKFPKYEDGKIYYGEFTKKLPISGKPISSTFAKIGSANLLDPCLDEEKAMDARLTLVTTDDGNLCAVQKGGTGLYAIEEADSLFEIALAQGKEIRKLI